MRRPRHAAYQPLDAVSVTMSLITADDGMKFPV